MRSRNILIWLLAGLAAVTCAGIFARYRLNEKWFVGFAVDHAPEFDFERPALILGLVGDPAAGEVDALPSV